LDTAIGIVNYVHFLRAVRLKKWSLIYTGGC